MQSSHWPEILRTDSASNHGARKDVAVLTHLVPLMGLLIAVAGVVTPLGLYDELLPSDKTATTFKYFKDNSAFGLGTPPRSNYPFSRVCRAGSQMLPCPFSNTVVTVTRDGNWVNSSFEYGYYNTSLPDIITDIYSSGTKETSTVSNFFDIQWRRYLTTISDHYNNGSTFLVGSYRPMIPMALNNATEIVEGLIVDTVNGGIGFRDHTIPSGFDLGATWTEDILFIEPETECVNINLTIHYTLDVAPVDNILDVSDMVLTDRGGFINLIQKYLIVNDTKPWINADLKGRAYKAAWRSNFYTMINMNITNMEDEPAGVRKFSYLKSSMNKTFNYTSNIGVSEMESLQIRNSWKNFIERPFVNEDTGSYNASSKSRYILAEWIGNISKSDSALT